MPEPSYFSYAALDELGKRLRGIVAAETADAAFDALKAKGLSPLNLKPTTLDRMPKQARRLTDREISAFVADLGALLRAGADMRMALSILAPKSGRPALQALARQMSADIAGGEALDSVFSRHLPTRHAFVAALVTAGEASGDLAGGLERAAEMMESRLEAKDQLVSILAYPAFILISALVALGVILFAVIPSLAPLAEAPGATPGRVMRVLLKLSHVLRENTTAIGVGMIVIVLVVVIGAVLGVWRPIIDRFMLRGPLRKVTGRIVYGSFAVSLGGLLTAGAPISDALRLGIRTTRSQVAQNALEPVLKAVRQGQKLSLALEQVPGFPTSIVRLAIVGEQAATLGPMLVRAGRFEERMALRQIGMGAKILGPALIVVLGALIGLLMTGLLTGISDLGESTLE